MRVITTNAELSAFSEELSGKPFIAVDTEFMREKTFWPVLCLIQAAAEGTEAIIDPLAQDIDLGPFLKVMREEKIIKVFHAARQDLEIFYQLLGDVPRPIFDTQIAAMACGYGDQIGYEPLMRDLLRAQIDKSSRFTDWSRRPLTEAQLAYALSDVTHLREAFPLLQDRLNKQSRLHWVDQEMDALTSAELYDVRPESAWRRMKLRNVRPKELGTVIKLAEWRENEAQKRNVPRNRILKDEAIFEFARLQPQSTKELGRARSVSNGFEHSSAGTAIIEAVKHGREIPKNNLPVIDKAERPKPPADVVELLKVLLKRQCELFDVAPKLVASANDLEEIALDDNAKVKALNGWRYDVFGKLALSLKRGELALKLKDGSVELVDAI